MPQAQSVTQMVNALKLFPFGLEDETQEAMYLALAQMKGTVLSVVPEQFKTEQVCAAAVVSECKAVAYLPKHFLTTDFFMIPVSKNPFLLHDVPVDLLTHDLCMAAVKANGLALDLVPDSMMNRELSDAALLQICG